MILTCPTCASQYSIDDAKLSDKPRTVRCANCKGTWAATAKPPEVSKPAPPPPKPTAPAPAPAPVAAAPPAAPAAPSSGPVAEPAIQSAVESAPELGPALAFRAKAVAKTRTREAVGAGMVWGVLAACVLVLVVTAVLFRVDVVRLWPRTAGAYAKVGLTVNPLGLAPENVEAGSGLVNGRAAVIVTGQIRNIQTRPMESQPLRIALLDKNGKRLAEQVAAPPAGMIAPDGVKAFSVQFIDPPAASKDVEVAFAFDLISARIARRGQPMASQKPIRSNTIAPAKPAPPVRAAEPLPEHSPDALPDAAHQNDHPVGKDG